jgi:hypothetical protein
VTCRPRTRDMPKSQTTTIEPKIEHEPEHEDEYETVNSELRTVNGELFRAC